MIPLVCINSSKHFILDHFIYIRKETEPLQVFYNNFERVNSGYRVYIPERLEGKESVIRNLINLWGRSCLHQIESIFFCAKIEFCDLLGILVNRLSISFGISKLNVDPNGN